MADPDKPDAEAFDWEASDAYEKWEQDKADFLKAANSLPREVLEQLNATANFQADRATDAFLKAADAMSAWRELALKAIELMQSERKKKITSALSAALLGGLREAEAKAKAVQESVSKVSAALDMGRLRGAEGNRAAAEKRARKVLDALVLMYEFEGLDFADKDAREQAETLAKEAARYFGSEGSPYAPSGLTEQVKGQSAAAKLIAMERKAAK